MKSIRMRTLDFAIADETPWLSAPMHANGLMGAAIIMPATWAAAGLSFAASETEDGTFLPLVDALGTEITLTVAAGTRVVLPLGLIYGHAWLKLQSGTSAAPVDQTAARVVQMLLRDWS